MKDHITRILKNSKGGTKMNKRKFLIFMSLLLTVVVLSWGVDQGWAQSPKSNKELKFRGGRVTPAERKAAAKRAKDLGLLPGVAALAIPAPGDIDGPGGIPHYFGPYGNWAYSPLPRGPVTAVTLTSGGTGYSSTPTVTISDVYGTGADVTFLATAVSGVVQPITIALGGVGADFSAPIVTITDPTGTGATATASIATVPIGGTLTGGIPKFVDKMPGLGPAGANNILQSHGAGQYISVAVADTTAYPEIAGPPAKPASDYYEIALVEFSEKMHTNLPPTRLRGYVQLETPGALAAMAAQVPPLVSKHVALGSGLFAIDNPHYLGPTIVANSDRPVRIKFYNLLPTGAGGNLFLPVDETVAGSGLGPAGPGTAGQTYTQNRAAVHLHGNNTVWISDGTPHQWITPANENTPYPQGVSVRNVPDMDPASVDAPIDGMMTIYYTNAMSARLMFYHDHAMGITRLNVYAGEAAGYVVTDQVDQDMINGTNVSGVNISPSTTTPFKKVLPDLGIPLVIQDRTFVDATTIYAQDPTWNWGTTAPGTANTGDLWYPHVYMSAQNPWDLTGTNAFGRWHYGPWFNPPVPTCVNGLPVGCIEVGPVPNPFYQPICDGLPDPTNTVCTAPWEPPLMPGNPNPSIPGEAFMDTPIVNGTAYPYLEVEPKAYRFRVLNAANDRFLNLQLYVAADKKSPTTAGTTGAVLCNGAVPVADCTEVAMVPVSVAPANQYSDWPSGLPDPATKGPDWIQIGTEGGFLPKPVVIPSQPVGWNLNPTLFNFGVVNQHSLLLGTAERADVVVDFSAYAGKTLILYNDAPAAFPAGVPAYDYFTGVADQMDVGGAPTTQPGYGPNTRTIMQIRVGTTVTTPTPDVTLANLEAVFAKGTGTSTKKGVFEATQDPIIIPQAAYNSAYNSTFPATAAGQYVQIADTQKTFRPIDANGVLQPAVTMPLEMKAMHDEMGGVYDTMFGRMSGMLGLSNPTSPVHVLIPYGYASPPTDIHLGSVAGSQIGSFPDGTQIWRIFHNGVDTHTIHVHLFNAQLINRLGQDGVLLPPDPNELGWKDTFRVNPLEITYIAMRPVIPTPAQVPFEVPDSIRLIDPTLPEGATLIPPPPAGWFDPAGNAIPEILNHYVNFGWEYVWHCHILAHEEMDMMHSLVFAVPPTASTGLAAAWNGSTTNRRVTLIWTDNSLKETGFTIQRATDANFTTGLTTFNVAANPLPVPSNVSYVDTTVANNTRYWYRVFAIGDTVGDIQTAGFPTMSANSVSLPASVAVGTPPTAGPTAPSALAATVQAGPQVSLRWTDNASNETGFVVERCSIVPPATAVPPTATCSNFAQIATVGPRTTGPATVTYLDTTVPAGNTYNYRVKAINAGGSSAYFPNSTTTPTVVYAVVPAIPAAPTGFTVAVVKANGNNYTATLAWAYTGTNPTNFTIQRATNATFTTGLSSFTPAGSARGLTQTVTRNTTYYYRIRANNNISGSSAWLNALPFPIRTGN
jgi:FtsP/CotA-like multicopper oxidase with cupredoxin domain